MSNWSRDLLGIRSYSETYRTQSISAGSLSLNLSVSLNFEVSLSSDISSITISNPPSGSTAFGLVFVGDGTARSVTWPASVKWPNLQPPAISSGSNRKDFLSFVTVDNGTNWYGFVAAQDL